MLKYIIPVNFAIKLDLIIIRLVTNCSESQLEKQIDSRFLPASLQQTTIEKKWVCKKTKDICQIFSKSTIAINIVEQFIEIVQM